jgi:pimeloyl-ACP methyl ester carboxylesterase
MENLITANGALTAARMGQGPDLVILHSLLTDRHAFDAVLPELSKDFRVTLLNLPGFHGSKPVEATMGAYVARVRQALAEFGIAETCTLMGNGFGGTVALAFALEGSDRLARLVLSDVAAGFPPEARQAFKVMADKIAAGGLGAIADIAANRVFHAAYLKAHPQAVEECRAVLLQIDPLAFRAACAILMDADLTPKLSHLHIPTLVVCGELDQATPPPLNKALVSGMRTARYVELPGCGHCPPLEQPQAFLAAIRDFLATGN